MKYLVLIAIGYLIYRFYTLNKLARIRQAHEKNKYRQEPGKHEYTDYEDLS